MINNKKILHLLRIEKFTVEFICFIKENSIYNHFFWIYGENDYLDILDTYRIDTNIRYFPRIDIQLHKANIKNQLMKFDMIIYHGVFENDIIEYFWKNKYLLRKLALYFWGGDIPLPGNWKEKIRKNYLIRNSAAIITIIHQDYEEIKKLYHPKGKHFIAMYCSREKVQLLNEIKNKGDSAREKTINIQLGNSATESNNHIEMLKTLEKFKDDDIKIYIPLSYGDINYAKQVIEFGKEIYGNKLIPIQEFMKLTDYYHFLSKMDIAIFAMERQQALGNIAALMCMGCKIYFQQSGKLWEYFMGELNCTIFPISSIRKINFNEFIAFSDEKRRQNEHIAYLLFDPMEIIELWEKIFVSF